MGFLRRLLSGPTDTRALAGCPDWAAPLRPQAYEQLAKLVQQELGRNRIQDVAELRDFATAAELSLPNLVPLLIKVPIERWPAFIHGFYEMQKPARDAGDAIEARAQTFDSATPHLRIHWMPSAIAPAGDVVIPGLVPDTIEVLALDAGTSIRHVSERLLGKWGVTVDEAVRVARQRVLTLPLMRTDLAEQGHPQVKVVSLEGEGPYAGALLTGLDQVDPAAIGAFGTLVGAPVGNALVYRALNTSPELRSDLSHLAAFTHRFAEAQEGNGFLKLPIWRMRDGSMRVVTFKWSGDLELLDSHDPGFAGVLAALDPGDLLPVPPWAQGILSAQAYTRFAGCVAAARAVHPSDVGKLASAFVLQGLAQRCRAAAVEAWPELAREHLATVQGDLDVATALVSGAANQPEAVRDHLVTWLGTDSDVPTGAVSRAIGQTGFVELLGAYAQESAVPVTFDSISALGDPDQLFELGHEAVRSALTVAPSGFEYLSGKASRVTGLPSPSGAIPYLMTWLPDVVGPYGALIAVGDGDSFEVLPIHDASVVLDLPALLGQATGANLRAAWPVPPVVFWLSADKIEAIHVEKVDGVISNITTQADIAGLSARLPSEPHHIPSGLEEILGRGGSRRFYGLLHAAVVHRLATDPAGLAELVVPSVRAAADVCRGKDAGQWAAAIDAWLDEMAGPRRELDRLTQATDYAEVSPWLSLGADRTERSGSELARIVGGGLALFPLISVGPRHRRVTHSMLEHWKTGADQCHKDAAWNTAHEPTLVDEPMFSDQPSVRQLYSQMYEREAAGLCLHLRYPGTRRGFVVSVTHGSRAHFIRLDDPGASALIPTFANVIADIYRRADAADDAKNSWLFWLTPDGRPIPLFDVLAPLPAVDRLPPEFVAMVESGSFVRAN